ncbi:MAG TPA: alpha/beta hydrolase [Chloroflexota bacterium]|nr:alpha/beta hydrolase [Chloroflexota bacterium]
MTFPGSDKPLDPQIREVLAARFNPDAPPLTSLTPEQVRASMPPGLPEVLAPIGSTRDLEAPGPAGPVSLRLYRPEAIVNRDAIIFFHGGGFVFGSIDTHENIARLLANSTGRPVISAGYRLAPEHPFPAAVEDAYAAFAWVAAHAAELDIAHGAAGIVGDSSGGTLAAVVSYLARERSGPPVSFQILINPALSMDMTTPSAVAAENGPGGTRAEMDWWIKYYLRSPEDAMNPLASPVLIPDLTGLPPALIVTAEYDPLNDGSRLYADRLAEAGVTVTSREYKGTIHGFLAFWRVAEVARRAFDDIGEFVRSFDGAASVRRQS